MAQRYYLNDTAQVDGFLYDEDGVTPLPAQTVSWSVKKPDGNIITGGPSTINSAQASIFTNQTDLTGLYATAMTFTLADGTTLRTVPGTFEIIDPLQVTGSWTTPAEQVIDRAWMKLEDLFDSTLGGPYLRDRTKALVDRDKMALFLPDALYAINNVYQPATNYDSTTFDYTNHGPLLSQGLLVETIYHLMRSYTEQPNPIGSATIGYFDRRDYQQRWQSLLTGEEQKFMTWLDLFKKGQMNFGQTSTLVGGYGNQFGQYPRYMRGRFPFVYRW